MIGTTVYSAGLMSQSFWFLEFKKAVRLRQEGCARAGHREAAGKDAVAPGTRGSVRSGSAAGAAGSACGRADPGGPAGAGEASGACAEAEG